MEKEKECLKKLDMSSQRHSSQQKSLVNGSIMDGWVRC